MKRSKGSQTKQQTALVKIKIRDFFVFSLAEILSGEELLRLRLSPPGFYSPIKSGIVQLITGPQSLIVTKGFLAPLHET